LWGISERKLFPPPTAATVPGAAPAAGPSAAKKPSDAPLVDKRIPKNGQAGGARRGKAKRRR
jgi:hypothetical protein